MPDTSQAWPLQPPAGRLPNRTKQLRQLVQAQATGCITQAEYRQYRDWYLGLAMLNGKTDNLITRRLWRGLWLPLGIERLEKELGL